MDVTFFNECLVPQGRFPTATAEKAWSKYHMACTSNLTAMSHKLGLHRSDTFYLCTKVFEQTVKRNYNSTANTKDSIAESEEPPLENTDKEILHYIGGSIVHSLKQKYLRANKQNTQSHMETLDCLLASEHPTETSTTSEHPTQTSTSATLTQLFDREGLSYIRESVLSVLELLEIRFRTQVASSQSTRRQFVRDSLEDRVLSSKFYNICYGGQAEEKTKEEVLQEFIKLFFKIRIHNKCKFFMDEYRNKHRLQSKKKSQKESQSNISLLL